MCSVAQSKEISLRDALGVIDSMLNANSSSVSQVVAVLQPTLNDPRCPVPKVDLAVRIMRLGV